MIQNRNRVFIAQHNIRQFGDFCRLDRPFAVPVDRVGPDTVSTWEPRASAG